MRTEFRNNFLFCFESDLHNYKCTKVRYISLEFPQKFIKNINGTTTATSKKQNEVFINKL